MKEMTSSEQRAMAKDLADLVGRVGEGADPEKELVKIASTKSYAAPKIERLCEAYNKSRSIHHLSTTGQEKRAESFPLVSAAAVTRGVFGETREKNASLRMGDLSRLDVAAGNAVDARLREIAACFDKQASPSRLSWNATINHMRAHKERLEKRAEDLERAVRMTRLRTELSVDNAATSLRAFTDGEFDKVARQVVNKYGAKGSQLMRILAAKTRRIPRDVQKTASTAVFRADEPYLSISEAMTKMREHGKALAEKEASHCKEALNLFTDLMSNLAAANITRKQDEETKVPKSPLDPEFENKLKSLDATDLFFDVYTNDDFLRNQPVEEAITAFNNVVQLMPSLLTRKNRGALVASLMKQQVARGGEIEPTEIEGYLKAEDKLRSEKAPARPEKPERPAPLLNPTWSAGKEGPTTTESLGDLMKSLSEGSRRDDGKKDGKNDKIDKGMKQIQRQLAALAGRAPSPGGQGPGSPQGNQPPGTPGSTLHGPPRPPSPTGGRGQGGQGQVGSYGSPSPKPVPPHFVGASRHIIDMSGRGGPTNEMEGYVLPNPDGDTYRVYFPGEGTEANSVPADEILDKV